MDNQGCSDGNCKLRIGQCVGMHTNGGCRCLRDVPAKLRIQIQRKLWSQSKATERLRERLRRTERALDAYALQLANEDLLDEHHTDSQEG